MVANLKQLGKSVFLTTHYMDEAQRLADRVAIIAGGRIVAEGRPDELGDRERRPASIRFRVNGGADDLPATLRASPRSNGELEITTSSPVEALHELTGWALDRAVELEGLEVRRPSLEDIYLELTSSAPDDDR